MKLTLVNLPINYHDVEEVAPPLGLLQLINSVSDLSTDIQLLDFNLKSVQGILPQSEQFYNYAVDAILSTNPNVVAFTSMGVNSHLGIQLSSIIKQKCHNIFVIFGGVHYSSMADFILDNYEVDIVVRGEGEVKFFDIIKSFNRASNIRNALPEIEKHPWESYSCVDLQEYFDVNPLRRLDIETGRGCKYNCSFCYSCDYWQSTRNFPIENIVEDFEVAFKKGARHLFIVNDNFINDRKFVRLLCHELAKLPKKPSWSCYLTLPDISRDIPKILSSAGCNATYIGIDAVTKFQRTWIGKKHSIEEDAIKKLTQEFIACGITPTYAFIIDPFSYSKKDLIETYSLALSLRMMGCELSFHYLTIYSDTKLRSRRWTKNEWVPDEIRVRILMDCPDFVYRNELSREKPQYFPFHSRTINPEEKFRKGIFKIHAIQNLLTYYPFEVYDIISSKHYDIISLLNSLYAKIKGNTTKIERMEDLQQIEADLFESMLLNDYNFEPI